MLGKWASNGSVFEPDVNFLYVWKAICPSLLLSLSDSESELCVRENFVESLHKEE
jgi:hypothetical protein